MDSEEFSRNVWVLTNFEEFSDFEFFGIVKKILAYLQIYITLHRIGGAIPAPYIALYLPSVTIAAMPFFVMGSLAGNVFLFVIRDLVNVQVLPTG